MKWWTFRVAVEIIVGFDESEPVARASHSVSASINCICCLRLPTLLCGLALPRHVATLRKLRPTMLARMLIA